MTTTNPAKNEIHLVVLVILQLLPTGCLVISTTSARKRRGREGGGKKRGKLIGRPLTDEDGPVPVFEVWKVRSHPLRPWQKDRQEKVKNIDGGRSGRQGKKKNKWGESPC